MKLVRIESNKSNKNIDEMFFFIKIEPNYWLSSKNFYFKIIDDKIFNETIVKIITITT